MCCLCHRTWSPLWVGCLLATAFFAGCVEPAPRQLRPLGTAFRLARVAEDPHGGGDAALSPDGQSVVVSSRRSGNLDLWLYRIDLGQWTRLTTDPAEDFEAQWSPDGRRLVFTSTRSGSKDVWRLDLDGSREVRLTSGPDDEEYPVWSPDGRSIAYTGGPWGQRDFYVIPATGGAPRRLTGQSGFYGACNYFPDGQSLVYHAYDRGTGDLYSLHLGDGDLRPLTQGDGWDYKASVSPDGAWIAFSRSDESPAAMGRASIWLTPVGPGRARPLEVTPHNDRWPGWDRSGRLFFHRIIDHGRALMAWDRGASAPRAIVVAPGGLGQACWDPSGIRVAYSVEEAGRSVIRILDLASGGTRLLPTGSGDARFPRWSPDGSRIAFTANGTGRWDVCAANLDGSGWVNWTRDLAGVRGMDGPIDWSPDGRRVVFHADTRPFEADLFVVQVPEGRVSKLTDDAWFDESPAFTPDGKGVTFMSTRGGNWSWGLYQLQLDSREISQVVAPDWIEKNFPRMTPRGSVLFTSYDASGVEHLAEANPGGAARFLTEAGPWARWPSLSPDGKTVLFTAIEHRVEYWIAEGLTGAGSPLTDYRANQGFGLQRAGCASCAADCGGAGPVAHGQRHLVSKSPADHVHR